MEMPFLKELHQHLEALHEWLSEQRNYPVSPPQLTPEERQRFKKLKEAVELHSKIGIAPTGELLEQLRQLEERAKIPSDPLGQASRKEQLDGLIEQLRYLLQTAQALRKEWQGASRQRESGAGASKKHYGISLLELLQAGFLTPEDRLALQWRKNGPVYRGKLNQDGRITVKIEEGWRTFDSLSAAALDIGGRPYNGWWHWFRINPDGSRTRLWEIREEFLQQQGKGG